MRKAATGQAPGWLQTPGAQHGPRWVPSLAGGPCSTQTPPDLSQGPQVLSVDVFWLAGCAGGVLGGGSPWETQRGRGLVPVVSLGADRRGSQDGAVWGGCRQWDCCRCGGCWRGRCR